MNITAAFRPFLMLVLLAFAGSALAQRLPVGEFFKDPEFTSVSLSPDGKHITVSVPRGDRTQLAAFQVDGMKLVGKWDYGENRHIERVRWVNDERFIMYVSRKTGRFDFRVGTPDLHLSNVDGKKRTAIPNGGTYQIVDMNWDDPDTILVQRSVDAAFLFKMNVYSGRTSTMARAPLRYGSFVVDSKNQVRYAVGQRTEDGPIVTLRRDGEDWATIHEAEMGESVMRPLGFDRDDERVLFAVSDAGEPMRLARVAPETNQQELLSRNERVDFSDLLLSADQRQVLAVQYEDGTPAYDFIEPEHPESKVYAGLINAFPNHAVSFGGISRDGRYILLRTYSDVDPGSYYLFDRQAGQARFLLAAREWIDPDKMSPMRAISLTARDGTPLHGYLTVPKGSEGKNLPLILNPHGGPHGIRDTWGFNPEVQFLANRGYAVLQINFRGSGGYGNSFERKGYRNWGTTMVDDMTDAVDWAIAQGIADPQRVCTYGASYGGYAALQSVVRNPEKYRCTVGYVGVYSIPLMFKDGDIPQSESGRAYLRRIHPESLAEQQAQSAAFNIDRIRIPVMLVQGGKDERVPPSQYRALKDGLTNAGRPPEEDILESKEGHGFYNFDNQVRLYTRMEQFLDRHIGAGAH
ncbi:alpha/beta fold hydrolase [Denitratimonas sp. CY0512]|uniref:S9 family peptidase n=1 Tax=Denitratimonas sp. CY0512 TaxID=3131940 RepID=UPI0030A5CA46